MIATAVRTLSLFVNGQAVASESGKYADIFDPSTGQVIARTPLCTQEEVNRAIEAARNAYPGWSNTPAIKRVQVLYKFRDLIDENLDELTRLVCRRTARCGKRRAATF